MKTKKGTSHATQTQRLKRIEGQVRGVISMIEEERYCVDILTQLKALKSALASVERNIINDHLGHCVQKAVASSNKKQSSEMIDEIKELLKKSLK